MQRKKIIPLIPCDACVPLFNIRLNDRLLEQVPKIPKIRCLIYSLIYLFVCIITDIHILKSVNLSTYLNAFQYG